MMSHQLATASVSRDSADLVWRFELVRLGRDDDDLVVHIADARGAPGATLGGLALRPGSDRTGKRDDVVGDRHVDLTRVEIGIAVERLHDVPITVSVLGADEVQQARIQHIGDVASRTPGLNFGAIPAP